MKQGQTQTFTAGRSSREIKLKLGRLLPLRKARSTRESPCGFVSSRGSGMPVQHWIVVSLWFALRCMHQCGFATVQPPQLRLAASPWQGRALSRRGRAKRLTVKALYRFEGSGSHLG